MPKSSIIHILSIFVIAILAVALLVLVGYVQSSGYEDAMRKNCKQYEIYPEAYIDKIPSGCVPQWFEVNK